MASSNLLEPQNPLSPVNRRISILVMTRDAEERLLGRARTPVEAQAEAPQPVASAAVRR